MLDLLLIASLGFLGSFGHCLGMCGPITAAFALSPAVGAGAQLRFHLLLNLGRILSYGLVGASIGGLGSVLVAGGQMAGVGSGLRRGIAVATGLLLIWFGLAQLSPQLPRVPLLNPMAQEGLHRRLSRAMATLSGRPRRWTPLLLGLAWGLMPCGFLYAAQLKAAETTSLWSGGATMVAFGAGTLPMMVGVGLSTARLSADRRSQLFRLGGWVTLTIGLLTLVRVGDSDYTGHGALLLLALALVARPLGRLWPPLLAYRRALGVGAFVLSCAHVGHMVTMGWDLRGVRFLLPSLQVGAWAGLVALALLAPLALTSFDRAQKWLGPRWRQLHLLSVPAFALAVTHTLLLGTRYLGSFEAPRYGVAIALGTGATLVLALRWRWLWQLLAMEKFYGTPK